MLRHLAAVVVSAFGLYSAACSPPGSHVAGTFSFTSSPAITPTLTGAAPIELFACPYWHREGGEHYARTLVVLGSQCVLRGEPLSAWRTVAGSKSVAKARTMAGSKIDPGQTCTVPLNGNPTTIVVRDGRMESFGSSVEVNLGGTTTVDGVERYVAVHFSGDETAGAEEGECESYLHPVAPS